MKYLLGLLFLLLASPAWAQNPTCPTRPTGDSSNACASTAFVQGAVTNPFAGLTGFLYGNGASPVTAVLPGSGVVSAIENALNTAGGLVGYSLFAPGVPAALEVSPNVATGFVLMPFVRAGFLASGPTGVTTITPIYDVVALGADPSGSADSSAAFQNALTDVAAGGEVNIPCGTYKILTQPSVTFTGSISFIGGGAECTTLNFVNISGPQFIYNSIYASVHISGLTCTTDQVATKICFPLEENIVNPAPGFNPTTTVDDIACRGNDFFTSQNNMWGNCIFAAGVSNVNVRGLTCLDSHENTTCVNFVGYTAGPGYATGLNVTDSYAFTCNMVVNMGDYTQGVNLNNVNDTNCKYTLDTPLTPSGLLTDVAVNMGQHVPTICGICINPSNFAGLYVTNVQMQVGTSVTGIKVSGSQYSIVGGDFGGAGTKTGTGIDISTSSQGQGGTITGGSYIGMGLGIKIEPSVNANVLIDNVHFVGNGSASLGPSTADYSIGTGSTNVTITDYEHRTYAQLPTCNSSDYFSVFTIIDSNTTTFNAAITAGGSNGNGKAYCSFSATGYTFH